jgi:hypothetical protein
MAALIFCMRLAESDGHCHSIRQAWTGYAGDNHMAFVVTPSAALAFVTTTSDKHKSTSPSVIQVRIGKR